VTRDENDDREWERGWDGHEDAQLRRLARLPMTEKLQWLEEAQRLAERLSRARPSAPERTPPEHGR